MPVTPSTPAAPRHLSARVLVPALLLVIAAGLAGFLRSQHGSALAEAVGFPPAASADESDGVRILLGLADDAFASRHLVAPEGANAVEFYLSVLQLDPGNAAVQARLASLLPAASAELEATINAGSLDEASRELRLLREVDAANYTLSLLGGKLDARRVIQVREDEARAVLIQAQAAGVP